MGNNEAFQELMEEEKVRLYKIAYVYVKNEEDALEIFQETIYKAYVSIKDLKEEKYFSTWITRILINTAYDYLKKKKRVIPMESDVLERKSTNYSSQNISRFPEKSDLLRYIEELDVKYKTVLILRFYKDYTIKQISSILECPEGTVKTNIHRAISLLRVKMKEDYTNDG